jgi:predicted metal-binding membrane protein
MRYLAKRNAPQPAADRLRMGLKHGGYCLGCCWVLTGLLFAFGVMNHKDL